MDAPFLGYPENNYPYTLNTDASMKGIGAILSQKQGMEDRVIEYASKTLSKCQQNIQPLSGNYLQSFTLLKISKKI